MKQNSAHIIIFNGKNEVLLVKRAKNDEWMPSKFAIPGGKRERGETLLQNVARETLEEVGLTLKQDKIKFLPKVSKKFDHCFFMTRQFTGNVVLRRQRTQ